MTKEFEIIELTEQEMVEVDGGVAISKVGNTCPKFVK